MPLLDATLARPRAIGALCLLALGCGEAGPGDAPSDRVDSGQDTEPDTGQDTTPTCLIVTMDKLGARGALEGQEVSTYDTEARRIIWSRDDDADGVIDGYSAWRFGEHGVLLYEERDQPTGALERRDVYSYDASGLLVLKESDRDGADGDTDSSERYEYDAEGRLTLESSYWHGDEVLLLEYVRYEYDAQGLMTLEERGYADGPYRWERHSYDDAQNLARSDYDVDVDGVADFWRVFTHDANGNVLSEEDADIEGVDWVKRYAYDGGDRVLSYTIDRAGDGDLDYAERSEYNTDGALLRFEVDHDADGIGDEVDVYVYEGPLLTRHDRDEDGDGVPERRHHYSYDGQDRVTRIDTERYPSEALESSTTFSYQEIVCAD